MANAPERFDAVFLPDGVSKISYEHPMNDPSTAVFRIEREDHTIGNLLRMQLLRDKNVIFAGYRQPHPLQHHIELRVKVKQPSSLSEESPVTALIEAITDLDQELNLLQDRFQFAVGRAQAAQSETG
ncbi:DNA-directed RNA polymerases II, IV and V subunit 11 [Porphyridium purpureum]|uniref:DNA-directed RNA polymerases II, IV and V subunit 11 n=1 Tax=Porphyridium purpureum TaxID=35688 RepID=A0A5J4YZM2_PORPP|nr:DNA-directed RNA polymerases II, IV and V subunit 11 [Porphyridium purpureum]|eukprot:POR1869..scf209_3